MIISGFQFRASRKVLNLTLSQLHSETKVPQGVLARLENKIGNLQKIQCKADEADILFHYFSSHNLSFPDISSLELVLPNKLISNKFLISRFQLIVARSILRLSQRSLGNIVGLSHTMITRMEKLDNNQNITLSSEILNVMLSVFSKNGITLCNNNVVILK